MTQSPQALVLEREYPHRDTVLADEGHNLRNMNHPAVSA